MYVRTMQGDLAVQAGDPVTGALADALGCLDQAVTEDTWRVPQRGLGQALEQLDALRRGIERLTLAVVADADQRGSATTAGASSLTDWVAGHSPSLHVRDAHQLVTVATACAQPCHGPLAEAVRSGLLPARKAARVLSALAQVRPFVDAEDYQADQHILIPLAATGTDRELTLATRHLIACAAPDRDTAALAAAQRQSRALLERPGAGGVTEFTWRLDPEGAAFVHAAISALGAPAPDGDAPDTRSPAQRRSDALMSVLQRGIASADGVPVSAKTKVVVTLPFDRLLGQVRGLAPTLTDDQLTPACVRRLACEADLLPMVLGTAGEPLDLGHTTRLATPAQRMALWQRDRGCTYPGCSIPPTWCEAHHVIHWCDGGPTDLTNLALLCGRHHTVVHERGLTATVTASGVTWHT
ncbi:HNH endonuclease [Oryzihumus leptocrescens]|uniref:HNH endonuclease n=2 Tax=Oryzihumus leptocrescens TaxID=297536 RepID=A0A542Z7X6_9MICO|nr:HNH endonuclease [Oryzihumus leptocrescens]